MSIITRLIFSLAILLFARHSTAAIVLSQAPPDPFAGFHSDFAAAFVNQQAQRVQLGADASIAAVVAWGHYSSSPNTAPDNFTIRFFVDAAGEPAAAFFDEQTAVPVLREATALLDPAGNPIYKYTFNLTTPVALTAATTYYISIVNNTSSADSWAWNRFIGGNDLRWHRSGAGAWGPAVSGNTAFELSDAPIPPSTMPIPTLGSLGLGFLVIALLLAGINSSRRQAR